MFLIKKTTVVLKSGKGNKIIIFEQKFTFNLFISSIKFNKKEMPIKKYEIYGK